MIVPAQFRRRIALGAAFGAGLAAGGLLPFAAVAQQLDMTHGGAINITAADGLEWRRAEQQIIARGDAKAVRGDVTVTADRLSAWYRQKAADNQGAARPASPPATSPPATAGLSPGADMDNGQVYRLEADGKVRIFTQTDQAQGDKAVFDMDQSVMVMTGHNLKLSAPNGTLTARDDLEYWPRKHMMVARGNAVVVTTDGRRVAADTLVAYTADNPAPGAAQSKPAAPPPAGADPLASSGRLQRVEAFGHVSVRTATDTVTGDRGVYVPDTGMARLAGNVQITRGQNQLNGVEADVDMKTGVATLIATPAGRVQGLVVPNDSSNNAAMANNPAGGGKSDSSGGKSEANSAASSGKSP